MRKALFTRKDSLFEILLEWHCLSLQGAERVFQINRWGHTDGGKSPNGAEQGLNPACVL